MKRCPECRRDYFDDSLLYCLDDGTALLEGPGSQSGSSDSEHATSILPDLDAATRQQFQSTDQSASTAGGISVAVRSSWIRLALSAVVVVTLVAAGMLG